MNIENYGEEQEIFEIYDLEKDELKILSTVIEEWFRVYGPNAAEKVIDFTDDLLSRLRVILTAK